MVDRPDTVRDTGKLPNELWIQTIELVENMIRLLLFYWGNVKKIF